MTQQVEDKVEQDLTIERLAGIVRERGLHVYSALGAGFRS